MTSSTNNKQYRISYATSTSNKQWNIYTQHSHNRFKAADLKKLKKQNNGKYWSGYVQWRNILWQKSELSVFKAKKYVGFF